ncbi:Hypothetical protein DHA2_5890 [Giardia duodenalis]|uniref:Uncharacterized protein n=1 Tax=Giardia intestinalis TaxID=5741 RepID=V6TJ37_GIAIN|nr:Hypothetical protein DHA2_5890 [Giardia intestinalis]
MTETADQHVAQRLASAEKKVDDLTEIVKHASSEKDKALMHEVLTFLREHRAHLIEANARIVAAEARASELEARNKGLEEALEKRDYQIEHLSRNMASVLDKKVYRC